MWIIGPRGDLINLSMAERISVDGDSAYAHMPTYGMVLIFKGDAPKDCEHFMNGIKGRLAVGTYHAVR